MKGLDKFNPDNLRRWWCCAWARGAEYEGQIGVVGVDIDGYLKICSKYSSCSPALGANTIKLTFEL